MTKEDSFSRFLKETRLDRRSFNKTLLTLAGLGLGAEALASCNRGPEENTIEFTEQLKELLQLNDTSTRLSVAEYVRTLPRDWMKNQPLGNFTNDLGQQVSVNLDRGGEPIYTLERKQIVTEPLFPPPFPLEVRQETVENNHYVIYGSVMTSSRLSEKADTLGKFMDEFFADSPASLNVLHLDFRTPGPRSYKQIGGPTTKNLSPYPEVYGKNAVMPVPGSETISRVDVVANFHALEMHTEEEGLDRDRAIRITLANEIFNVHQRTHPNLSREPEQNEAPSTIAGLLAGFDNTFAKKMLGGTSYAEAFEVLAEEMEDLRSIGA